MIYLVDFRVADVGGAVASRPIVSCESPDGDLGGEPRITFLVHGYNVSRPQGRESLLRLARALQPAVHGALAGVLWPGDHWARAASYPFEGRDADDAGRRLAEFLARDVRRGAELSFVAHSLGARVAMEAIRHLDPAAFPVRQVCLLAAAIDDFSVAAPRGYRPAVEKADRVAVLASRKDRVLRLAYPAGDLLQAFLFFWREESGLALGYHGPRPRGAHAVPGRVRHEQIPDARESDHGDYLPGGAATPLKNAHNQASAVHYVRETLAAVPQPVYP